CLWARRVPLSSRWLAPSNGGSYGRQVTQVETARPEAEGRHQGREGSRGKVQARQLQPPPAARGEGQEVGRRMGAARGAGIRSYSQGSFHQARSVFLLDAMQCIVSWGSFLLSAS